MQVLPGTAPPTLDPPTSPPAVPLPEFLFGYQPGGRLERTPVQAEDVVLIVDTTGQMEGVYKKSPDTPFQVDLGSPVTAPMAQYGTIAYVASLDQHVTAIDLAARGRLAWQFVAAAPVRIKPAVTDEDVYITAEGAGLHRVNRRTGEEIWRNVGAGQFLAANKTLVYARDLQGARLLIIDRLRGTTLTSFDIRDFVFPVSNEFTDRLYLAANDGSLVCVFDRDYLTPLSWRPAQGPPPPPTKPAPKAAPQKSESNPADEKPAEK